MKYWKASYFKFSAPTFLVTFMICSSVSCFMHLTSTSEELKSHSVTFATTWSNRLQSAFF